MRYHRPRSVDEALALLAEDSARPLLGGTDLMVALRHGTAAPEHVVDLKGLPELAPAIVHESAGTRVGARTTLTQLVGDAGFATRFPAVVEGARLVGSVQIRNRATMTGNVCNASPVADTAPGLLVHGASVRLRSTDGERDVPLSEFFLGPRRTACRPDELVTSVWLPLPRAGSGSAFRRLTRRRGVDLSTVSAAASVGRDGRVVVALGAVAARPLVIALPEPVDLDDEVSTDEAIDRASALATPISDVRGSADYRRAMTRVLVRRTIAAARTGGQGDGRG